MGEDSFFLNAITKIREKDSVVAKALLQDAYQQAAGVFDYMEQVSLPSDKKRPLASVALHAAEDLSLSSHYSMMLERYARAKVGDYFKLSIDEFLDLPLIRIEEMLKICQTLLTEDADRLTKLTKQT
mgnify:CR=1 FL=1